jgi:hypothetical protein
MLRAQIRISQTVLNSTPKAVLMAEGLSELEVFVLRSIKDGRSLEDIAKRARIPAAVLGEKVATLQIKGYLADDGALTAKAVQALADELGAPGKKAFGL